MNQLTVNLTYPESPDFEYETFLERLNLDKEREEDILKDNGFIISDPKGLKKDIRDPNGMFSPKYGQSLKDLNTFGDRYKCECGHLTKRINNDILCPICKTRVKRVGDNFGYFGWKVLKDHYIIHPNLYKAINAFMGKNILENIIRIEVKKDEDGLIVQIEETEKPKNEPFFGIGMSQFKERFDEVMEYYNKGNISKRKKEFYYSIMQNREKVFIQSVPYMTTLLRPIDESATTFYYEDSNSYYYIMLNLIAKINKYDQLKMTKENVTYTEKLLYDLQIKYNLLYANQESCIDKKKGDLRKLLSGRFNMSSRCVIAVGPELKTDEITLPYKALVVILQQRIVNILHRFYNINYSDAYKKWYKAVIKKDSVVVDIINSIIQKSGDGRGIPFFINRNPTLHHGGIFQVYCVGMEDAYVMRLPIRILVLLNADFDGDVLNILQIINDAIYKRATEVYNPRNSFQISRNDGRFNEDVGHGKAVIINYNSAMQCCKDVYTDEDRANLNRILNKWKTAA